MVNTQPLLAKPLPSAFSWRLLVMLSFKSIKKCYNGEVRFPYQTNTSKQSNAYNKSAKYKRLSRPFAARKRFRQVDVLSTLFFNVVLEAIVRRAKLKTTATIFNKQTQLLVGWSLKTGRDAFQSNRGRSSKNRDRDQQTIYKIHDCG
jgi:hypothetical protein